VIRSRFRSAAAGTVLPILLAWLAATEAAVHHGVANFDLNAGIQITGVVTEVAFVNPHAWLYLDVAGDDGTIAPWQCELRGASVLRRSGWDPGMFAPGTEVTVTGAPDRFEPRTCYLGTARFADGTAIDRYGQIARPREPVDRTLRRENGDPNIAGDWAAEQRVLTDPRGMAGAFLPIGAAGELEPGAVPPGTAAFPGVRGTAVSAAEDPIDAYWNRPSLMPLTGAGAEAIASFDGASSDNPRLRCETTNILFDWAFESDVNRVVQGEDQIMLLYGSMGLERTIHLNVGGHPDDLVPTRAGHSIGRWETDVLVVDTVGFLPGILSADGRVPHSGDLHVVERFSLDPETMALTRRYTAEDPLYFTGEYSGADAAYPAEISFEVRPCDDRSYRSDGASVAETAEPTPSRRWPAVPIVFLLVALPLTLVVLGRLWRDSRS
jgi:hypothetical protein